MPSFVPDRAVNGGEIAAPIIFIAAGCLACCLDPDGNSLGRPFV